MKGSILFKPKHLRILLALRDGSQSWTIASLSKAAGCTYVLACNLLSQFENMGITRSERHGASKSILLTEKGARIAELLAESERIMSSQAQNAQQGAAPSAQKPAADQPAGT